MSIYAQETYLNATEDHMIGESPIMATCVDEPGELYRTCQEEFGRCIGKVYRDTAERTIACGWVFQSRERYQDSSDTYLREVWVTLYQREHEVTIEEFPYELEGRA